MNADPSGTLAQLIDAAIQKRLSALHVAFPCDVISFDKVKRTATVQPRTMQSPLQNVRVLSQRIQIDDDQSELQRPFLVPGDVVYVVCSDQQLTNAGSTRMHDKNDAVVVGVFPCGL